MSSAPVHSGEAGLVRVELSQAWSHAAPALALKAAQIRARLGAWAPAPSPWRLRRREEGAPAAGWGPGDLVFCEKPGTVAGERDNNSAPDRMRTDAGADAPHDIPDQAAVDTAALLTQGAAIVTPTACGVDLALGERVYGLLGTPEPLWQAALAAFLDCGFDVQDALCLAWGWRDEPEAGDAWPPGLAALPQVAGLPEQRTLFAHCPASLGLYPVVPDAQWVERLLALGVKTVQLRCKAQDPAAIEAEVSRAVAAGRAYDAHVFINDHWQLALQAGAYGVHLGQDDWPAADLEALAQSGMRLGLSTHGIYEMLVAWHFQPSYIASGAVFPTATKQVASAPQGLARLRHYVALLGGEIPSVAIGGIGLAQLPDVLACGVGSAAVVSAITGAPDVAAAVAALQQVFDSHAGLRQVK